MRRFLLTLLAGSGVLSSPSLLHRRLHEHEIWQVDHFQQVIQLKDAPSCWNKDSTKAECRSLHDGYKAAAQWTDSTISRNDPLDHRIRDACIVYRKPEWLGWVEKCAKAQCSGEDIDVAVIKHKDVQDYAKGKCNDLLPDYSKLMVSGFVTTFTGGATSTIAPVRFSANAWNFDNVPTVPTGAPAPSPTSTPKASTPKETQPAKTTAPQETPKSSSGGGSSSGGSNGGNTNKPTQNKPEENEEEAQEEEEEEDRDSTPSKNTDPTRTSSSKSSSSSKPKSSSGSDTEKEPQKATTEASVTTKSATKNSNGGKSPTMEGNDTEGFSKIGESDGEDGSPEKGGSKDSGSSGDGNGNGSKNNLPKLIGLAVGIIVAVILIVGAALLYWQRRRYAQIMASTGGSRYGGSDFGSESSSVRRAILYEKTRRYPESTATARTRSVHEIFSPCEENPNPTYTSAVSGVTPAHIRDSSGSVGARFELPAYAPAHEMLVEPSEMAPVVVQDTAVNKLTPLMERSDERHFSDAASFTSTNSQCTR